MEGDDARGYFGYYAEATGKVYSEHGVESTTSKLCESYLVMTASPYRLIGSIYVDTVSYEVQSINQIDIALYEKMALPDTVDCNFCYIGYSGIVNLRNLKTEYAAQQRVDLQNRTALDGEDGRCQVDVVVATTPEARAEGVTDQDAFNVVFQANLGLLFSEIITFRFRYAGYAELVTTTVANGTLFDDIIPNLTASSEVSALATTYGADQTLVIVQSEAYAGYFGASELTTAPANRDLVTIENGSAWRYTGPHELAHNLGCKHNTDDTAGGPGQLVFSARGHVFQPDPGHNWDYLTVMSLFSSTNQNRILKYSDPQGDHYGDVTGTIDRDNVNQLESYGCTAAGLRDSKCIGVDVTGPGTTPRVSTVEYRASSSCPAGTTGTITWYIAVGLAAPFTLYQQGGTTVTYTSSFTSTQSVAFLVVLDCDGIEYSDIQYTWFQGDGLTHEPCQLELRLPESDPTLLSYEIVSADGGKVYGTMRFDFEPQILTHSDVLGRRTTYSLSGLQFDGSGGKIRLPSALPAGISAVSLSDGRHVESLLIYRDDS